MNLEHPFGHLGSAFPDCIPFPAPCPGQVGWGEEQKSSWLCVIPALSTLFAAQTQNTAPTAFTDLFIIDYGAFCPAISILVMPVLALVCFLSEELLLVHKLKLGLPLL